MAWTIDQPIRVGDHVTNLMLGQMALEIDALHDGFVGGVSNAAIGATSTPYLSSLNNPSGLQVGLGTHYPPYVLYSFSTGYKRKAPYLVTVTFGTERPTSVGAAVWIIRQPHYIADAGREYTDPTQTTNQWGDELVFNSIISNIDPAEPTAYVNTDVSGIGTPQPGFAMRFVEHDPPARYQYSDGTTLIHYDDFYHVAIAPNSGSASDSPIVWDVSMSILGGR